MKSWRTTLCGILTVCGAAITLVAVPLMDCDPNTHVNFEGFVTAFFAAIGLYFARDKNVSSEDEGLK